MISNKYTMSHRALDALRSIVEEEGIPVLIEEGGLYIDCHGDSLIDVCLSYAPENEDVVSEAMVRAINSVIGILID